HSVPGLHRNHRHLFIRLFSVSLATAQYNRLIPGSCVNWNSAHFSSGVKLSNASTTSLTCLLIRPPTPAPRLGTPATACGRLPSPSPLLPVPTVRTPLPPPRAGQQVLPWTVERLSVRPPLGLETARSRSCLPHPRLGHCLKYLPVLSQP